MWRNYKFAKGLMRIFDHMKLKLPANRLKPDLHCFTWFNCSTLFFLLFIISWALCSSPSSCLVQSLSCVQLFVTPWTAALQANLPLPSPVAYSNPYLWCQWCHPNISSAVPFSFCHQSFPASGSFLMSQFLSDGQSIGASALVLPVNTIIKVMWMWSLSRNILLHTLKVFLILTQHSPHTVAVTFAACGVTEKLTQSSSSSFFTTAQADSFLPKL